jgi:hypothetical protein
MFVELIPGVSVRMYVVEEDDGISFFPFLSHTSRVQQRASWGQGCKRSSSNSIFGTEGLCVDNRITNISICDRDVNPGSCFQ